MQEYVAGITRIDHISERSYLIYFSCPEIAETISPGQFVQIRVSDGSDPFLRRTFSVCDVNPTIGTVTLLVDIVGPGTDRLCTMQCGGTLNVLGPLGTGFDMALAQSGNVIMVAGGTGAAPLIHLTNILSHTQFKTTYMMGGRNESSVKIAEMMLDDSIDVLEATEDGSVGYHGLVTGLLKEKIEALEPAAIFTCGPHRMMQAVADIAIKHSIPCQVSLEERMACGIGACLGCAVETSDGAMVRSCVDGPVFNAGEVIL